MAASMDHVLAELSNPTPHFEDVDIDKLESEDTIQDYLKGHGGKIRNLKRKSKPIEEDVRYRGKKSSRKSFIDDIWGADTTSSSKISGDDEYSEEEGDDEDMDEQHDRDDAEQYHGLGRGSESEANSDDVNGIGDDDDDWEDVSDDDGILSYNKHAGSEKKERNVNPLIGSEEISNDKNGKSHTTDEQLLKHVARNINPQEEMEKAVAAKNQLCIFEKLLTSRIKLHKLVNLVNTLPHPTETCWNEETSNKDKLMKQGIDEVTSLIAHLLSLQTKLLVQSPDAPTIAPPSNSSDMTRFEEDVSKRYEDMMSYKNNIIEKWDAKTQVTRGLVRKKKDFSAFNHSTVEQIKQILVDHKRLIKRTQIGRSITSTSQDDLHDPEIFDDTDFYQQQLRDFIQRKTENIDDPIALSRQWLQIQRIRSKQKRKIDPKSSKGRRVRYNVHEKLVNFMAPVNLNHSLAQHRHELCTSLFGKRPESYQVLTK